MSVELLRLVESERREDVVRRLRGLLAKAERGEVLSLTYIVERPEGLVTFGCTGCRDAYVRLGLASRLLRELHGELDDRTTIGEFVGGDEL